ncbi:hypothetical protein BH10PSE12_BH10PSE12_37530 [soil metagenome]
MSLNRVCLTIFGLGLIAATPAPAQAAWSQALSPHFIVYSEGRAKSVVGFAEKLEKFDYLLRTMTGVKEDGPVSPVRVYMLGDGAQVESLAGRKGIAGYYSTSARNAFAVVTRGTKDSQFDIASEDILFHEYAHHFMLHYFPAAYPAWYVEGFAEFYSVVKFPADGAIEFGHVPMYRVPDLVMTGLYPLDKLFTLTTAELTRADMSRFYATAWLLTHYFRFNGERGKQFQVYLRDLTNGTKDVTIANHFAGGVDALEKELRAYMRGRLSFNRLTPKEMPAISAAVTPLEPARAALIVDEIRIQGRVAAEARAAIADRIRLGAARFPQSAYAQALLADAEQLADHDSAALAAADRALAIDPAYEPAMARKAALLLDMAAASDKADDWTAARKTIVQANRADLEDPVPLVLYYRYQQMKGGPMPEVAFDGLFKAYRLLPQNSDYSFMLATAFANRKDYDSAINVLGPIAFSPHASGAREAAIKLSDAFAQAKAGKVVSLEVPDTEQSESE